MPKKLKKLKITEVSSVDRGANQGAKIEFWKRDGQQTNGDNDMELEAIVKKLEELEASNSDLKKSNEQLQALASLTDGEKSFIEKLDEAEKEAFMKMGAEDKKKKMEEKEKMDMKKSEDNSELSQELAKRDQALATEIAKRETLEAEIQKMKEKDAFNEFKLKISKRVPALASEAKEDLAKSLFGMEEANREVILAEMEAVEKAKNDMAFELGTSMRGEDDAQSQLDKLVAKRMEDNSKEDYTSALEAVTKTAEGAALYEQTRSNAN